MDDLLHHLAFGDAERARLAELHDKLAPELPAIAHELCEVLAGHAETAAILGSAERAVRVRAALVDWMASGLRGPHDAAFAEARSRIGRKQVELGLAQQYIFAAMNVMRTRYHAHVAKLYAPAEALDAIRTVDKLLDLELGLMLRYYQLDSEHKLLARERAMQADRVLALQTLAAGLAHEVRNPLNAAKLQLELLERRLRKLDADGQFVERAELAAFELGRLANLLDDFLAFACVDAVKPKRCDAVAIVRAVLDAERPTAERARVELSLEAPGVLNARLDVAKLHEALSNIVRNAIEAAPHGHVRVFVDAADGALRVRVVDDGPGIPEAVRRRIFEPFFSTKEGGTGLGMSIAHSFVAMHGGRIEVGPGDGPPARPGAAIAISIPLDA